MRMKDKRELVTALYEHICTLANKFLKKETEITEDQKRGDDPVQS